MAKRSTQKSGLTRRQVSRIEREKRAQRAIWIGVGIVAASVIVLVGYSVVNEQVIKPNKPVITINGEETSVAEFQDRLKFEYYFQYGYQPMAEVGTDPLVFGQSVMETIIREKEIEEKAKELGVTVTEEEAIEQLELAVGYDSGEPEPTVTPWPTSVENDMTSTPTATFVYTRTPRPTSTLEPGVTPTLTATPTETPDGPTPEPTITQTPVPTYTPIPMSVDEYNETLDGFIEGASEVTGLDADKINQYLLDWARVTYLEKLLIEELDYPVDEVKIEVHASHILVNTEEEALAALERVEAGEEFEAVAAEISTDDGSAYKGGDLGWFGSGEMVPEFEEATFALEVGEISEPIPSEYGWHVIKLYDRDDEVPTLYYEKLMQENELFEADLLTWKSEIEIDIAPDWVNALPELP